MKKSLSLKLHKKLSGKLEVNSKIRIKNRNILSQIYTPGVAQAVLAIKNNKNELSTLTIKNNTVAVVTDGSAVLGMGNVGAFAAIPVMEGKCAIFKEFAGLNAFPICLLTQNTEEIINTIRIISPVFGAINLEDIASPKCFFIEEKLQNLGIPVMHDDQHATAIVVLAGLINALKAAGKDLKKCRIVVNGAGAAGTAIIKLLYFYGCMNLIAVDSEGIISHNRKNLEKHKKDIAKITNRENLNGPLKNAVHESDILIGVSQKGLFSKKMIASMNRNAVVFALANPDPEIKRRDALSGGAFIYASGRSDEVNQINNALVFPGFFKGLIDNRIIKVTNKLKIKAAESIAKIIRKPTIDYFIPEIFNRRLADVIAKSLGNQ